MATLHNSVYLVRATSLPKSPSATSDTRKTRNAHCCAMRWQRRLSTAFAAAGHPALRLGDGFAFAGDLAG
jgi:hypothetical protein